MIKVDSRTDFLTEVAKHLLQNSVCAELGVYRGEFSVSILDIIKPKTLHLVDPWKVGNDKNGVGGYGFIEHTAFATSDDHKYVKKLFSSEIKLGQVVLHKKYSYDALRDFADNYFDFIYIDACHLYDAVKADLNGYLPKLKPTGLMCGHDYVNVNNFGVIQAVDEFINEQQLGFLILNENQHDWALVKAVALGY